MLKLFVFHDYMHREKIAIKNWLDCFHSVRFKVNSVNVVVFFSVRIYPENNKEFYSSTLAGSFQHIFQNRTRECFYTFNPTHQSLIRPKHLFFTNVYNVYKMLYECWKIFSFCLFVNEEKSPSFEESKNWELFWKRKEKGKINRNLSQIIRI